MSDRKLTKSQEVGAEVHAYLRARNPLLWVVTGEEARAERHLFKAAADAGYIARTWDCAQGVAGMDGKVSPDIGSPDINETLATISARADNGNERGVWIMRDLPIWLDGTIGITTLRLLRNLARKLPSTPTPRSQALIVLSPTNKVPAELANHATVIEWPLPDRAEIADILDVTVKPYGEKIEQPSNGVREAAIDAAVGMTGEEAAACYARSIVQHKRIDAITVANEKKRIIAKEGVLEWLDPLPGGLGDVGGLDQFKTWLKGRSVAFTPKARAYGLPVPRGTFAVGISGCGKTYMAKALASEWRVPLLRLDPNALKGGLVGESERNIRKALRVIEALGRCVVLVDEIEKALQGATTNASDGGVSADALGTLLTWMQERKGEAFLIATANDISNLPPEMLRKGRWDELWWVDLPNRTERMEVLRSTLRSHKRGDVNVDYELLTDSCVNFTGAEIAALVPDALYTAFADGEREINTADLLAAARTTVPLAETAKGKIEAMRNWAKGKARPATSAESVVTGEQNQGRVLDF